jgi:hypothetical protein
MTVWIPLIKTNIWKVLPIILLDYFSIQFLSILGNQTGPKCKIGNKIGGILNLLFHNLILQKLILKFRVATSDLSIISGCKSLLCQPAVKGANMPWPLNLEESLCRSAIARSLHGVTEHNCVTIPTAYPFSSVEADCADGAELKCLTEASNKLSACPCKLAVPVTCFNKLLACEAGKKGSHMSSDNGQTLASDV